MSSVIARKIYTQRRAPHRLERDITCDGRVKIEGVFLQILLIEGLRRGIDKPAEEMPARQGRVSGLCRLAAAGDGLRRDRAAAVAVKGYGYTSV